MNRLENHGVIKRWTSSEVVAQMHRRIVADLGDKACCCARCCCAVEKYSSGKILHHRREASDSHISKGDGSKGMRAKSVHADMMHGGIKQQSTVKLKEFVG